MHLIQSELGLESKNSCESCGRSHLEKEWQGWSLSCVIDGPPIPLARHRVVGRRHYDPQSGQKSKVREIMLEYKQKHWIGSGPFSVFLIFYMPIPARLFNQWQLPAHESKPDIDNLFKFYADCGNEILWPDDSEITRLGGIKIYSNNPRTCIYIKPIKTDISPMCELHKKVLDIYGPEDLKQLFNHSVKLLSLLDSVNDIDVILQLPDSLEKQELLEALSKFLIVFSTQNAKKMTKINKLQQEKEP